MVDQPSSFQADQDARHACGADRKWRLAAQSPQPEVTAIEEPLALDWRRLHHHRRNRRDRTLRDVDGAQGLVDLKRPGPAGLGVDVAPVVEANVTSLFS